MNGAREDPKAAWSAAQQAVAQVMGACLTPPGAKTRRGGRVAAWSTDRTLTWRSQLAIYTAVVGLNVGVRPLLPHVEMTRNTVRYHLARLEALRDNPAIDQLLDLLQSEARRLLDGGRVLS